MRYQPSESKEWDLSCFNQCLRKRQAKHWGLASMSEQSHQKGCFLSAHVLWRVTVKRWSTSQRVGAHDAIHQSHVIQGGSQLPRTQWLCSTGTYPSASSIGSGGVSREADGMTVLVPRETLSCSVFVDREATAMGCSRVVVMPVVTVRLWPEPLRVRSGVGRSGLRMLTRQKAEPLLGMKFTLFLSGQ